MSDPARILVVRIDAIGDLICTTPLLHALRLRFPHARIDVLVNEGVHAVLDGNPDVDQVLIDYRRGERDWGRSTLKRVPQRLANMLALRLRRYDVAISAHYGMHHRAIELCQATRAGRVIQSVEARYLRRLSSKDAGTEAGKDAVRLQGNTINVEHHWGLHEVEGIFRLLEPLGVVPLPGPLRLSVTPAEAQAIAAKIEARGVVAGLARDALTVGINLSASTAAKRWPREQFMTLIRRYLAEFPQARLLLIHAPRDPHAALMQDCAELRSDWRARIVVLDTPRLASLFAAVAACDVLVGSEGGAMHVAAALQVPQVVMFENLPAKLRRWHPWQAPYRIVHGPAEADPVPAIAAVQVFDALRELIAGVRR